MDSQQYGFYDAATQRFYAVPARNQEEFRRFLEAMGLAQRQETRQAAPRQDFDDFDFVIEEVSKTPSSAFSQKLIQFDL